jgi:hypothetical protein
MSIIDVSAVVLRERIVEIQAIPGYLTNNGHLTRLNSLEGELSLRREVPGIDAKIDGFGECDIGDIEFLPLSYIFFYKDSRCFRVK